MKHQQSRALAQLFQLKISRLQPKHKYIARSQIFCGRFYFLTNVKGIFFQSSQLCICKQTLKMKNYKTLIFTAMMGFPLSFSAQTAPSFKELIDAAMTKDATIEQQNLESKSNLLDQQKLKDIFLPTVEISGKDCTANTCQLIILKYFVSLSLPLISKSTKP